MTHWCSTEEALILQNCLPSPRRRVTGTLPQRCRKGKCEASGPRGGGGHLCWCHSFHGHFLSTHWALSMLWDAQMLLFETRGDQIPWETPPPATGLGDVSVLPIRRRGVRYFACLRHFTPVFDQAPVYLSIFLSPLKNVAFAKQACLPFGVQMGR